jgi:hypothetical protein
MQIFELGLKGAQYFGRARILLYMRLAHAICRCSFGPGRYHVYWPCFSAGDYSIIITLLHLCLLHHEQCRFCLELWFVAALSIYHLDWTVDRSSPHPTEALTEGWWRSWTTDWRPMRALGSVSMNHAGNCISRSVFVCGPAQP